MLANEHSRTRATVCRAFDFDDRREHGFCFRLLDRFVCLEDMLEFFQSGKMLR